MGYDTKFTGRFAFSRPLTAKECAILQAVHDHRHQDDFKLPYAASEIRPVEIEREIFKPCYIGEGYDSISKKYPSRYCKWTVSLNKRALVWDKMEKFYNYVNWLEYLISHFFAVWGVQLNGTIKWKGANRGDQGTITMKNNKIRVEMPLARADSPRAPAP
jgi:hypothetical protein